ncbi:ElyC/SanA/YdcF family protein [Francisella salimarina]|uniref:ElyC/SanA/YdcF family protein n=1 Tax=Francisella salimarina TaxID=2599927 RepID=UPI001FEADDED|nr:ElyC/SanA/YdcF family protein [Francisella salimarina]
MRYINIKLATIILAIIGILSPGFANKSTSSSIASISLKQKAIENVQYSIFNQKAADTYLHNAINALELAMKQTDPDSKELLQLGLSLFSLQIETKEYNQAGETLDMLVENFPDNPIVQIYDSAYSYIFDFSNFRKTFAKLETSKWPEMPVYINAFDIIKRSFNLHINTNANQIQLTRNSIPVIVILGSPLNSNASMNEYLVRRLFKGLDAYYRFSNARIIVSGGRVTGGKTESYQMRQWLVNSGVPLDKIILEDQSFNMVWQGVNTFSTIKNMNPKPTDIILVDSTANIRRASAIFKQEAFDNNMLDIKIHNLASETKGYNIMYPLTDYEKVMIIKDTLRAAGIWEMPGMIF